MTSSKSKKKKGLKRQDSSGMESEAMSVSMTESQ